MFKLALGSFAAAVAMFITGFVFFATPLGMIAYTSADETQTAAVQAALAANLPKTGTYMVPDPSTQSGTTLYGKGPVAMVHYNSSGFPRCGSKRDPQRIHPGTYCLPDHCGRALRHRVTRHGLFVAGATGGSFLGRDNRIADPRQSDLAASGLGL